MTPAQKDRIKQQKVDTEATIEREVTDFYTRYPTAPRRPSLPAKTEQEEEKTNIKSEETMGEPQVEPNSGPLFNSNVKVETTNPPDQANSEHVAQVKTEDSTPAAEHELTDEHNGEIILENEEDTVIY